MSDGRVGDRRESLFTALNTVEFRTGPEGRVRSVAVPLEASLERPIGFEKSPVRSSSDVPRATLESRVPSQHAREEGTGHEASREVGDLHHLHRFVRARLLDEFPLSRAGVIHDDVGRPNGLEHAVSEPCNSRGVAEIDWVDAGRVAVDRPRHLLEPVLPTGHEKYPGTFLSQRAAVAARCRWRRR